MKLVASPMEKLSNKYIKAASVCLSIVLVSSAVIIFLSDALKYGFKYPLSYKGDSLTIPLIAKTMQENGWFVHNTSLGLPYGTDFLDFPISDLLQMVILKICVIATCNWVAAINIDYIMTYPLIALVSYYVYKRLGLNTIYSCVASILFAFMPYHILKNIHHLFLATYVAIPLSYYICFKLLDDENKVDHKVIIASMIVGISGAYYAFIACYMVMIACGCRLATSRSIRSALAPIASGMVILMSFIATILPSLWYWHEHGKNSVAVIRNWAGAEQYAFKLSTLLLPVKGHRIEFLNKISTNYYNETITSSSEAICAALGCIASVGFIILLSYGIFFERKDKLLSKFSALNVSLFLLGTMGGIGALFSFLISDGLRSYARVGIFIAFVSLWASFYILQKLIDRYISKNIIIASSISGVIILIFGLYDQTSTYNVQKFTDIQNEYDSDLFLVKSIESMYPSRINVLQLPIHKYPEGGKTNQMSDYEHIKPYLMSKNINWSYCAMKGRKSSIWQEKISGMPIREMISEAKKVGFNGVYIDRRGYIDRASLLEAELKLITNNLPIVSRDNNKSYVMF